MIERTEAVCLRIMPYSRTSHVVAWLTPRYGRLVTNIKGACRPKSLFLGQYDLFQTCELLFYVRDLNGLHAARACSPLKRREVFRTDWRAAALASYVCDLVWRISLEKAALPELFALTNGTLDRLCVQGYTVETLLVFELRLLGLLGLAPSLDSCPVCSTPLPDPPRGTTAFSHRSGGLVCNACARQHAGSPARPRPPSPGSPALTRPPRGRTRGEPGFPPGSTVRLDPAMVDALRAWQRGAGISAGLAPRQTATLRNLLGAFVAYHLDIKPASRMLTGEIVRWRANGNRKR